MIINDLDGYYIVFDTKNWNTELDTLKININVSNMITEKILKELGFERHPALHSQEFWDLWLSDNTYNEKEHKFNRVLYIKVDFYDTDNSWYASRNNYIKDGSCNVRLGLGPGGPHDCSEEFPLLRRLKDAEKLKALIEILKGE